jgi:hypothetical protein
LTRLAPLVLSGAPRSGTTLIYTLFDSHPEIAWLVSEGYFFEYLYDLGPGNAELFLRAARGSPERLVEGLRDREMMPSLHLPYRQDEGTTSKIVVQIPWSEERFLAGLRVNGSIAPDSMAELWNILARAYAAGLGTGVDARYACLKSPDYGKSAVAAVENVPEARAIVIVRDPLKTLDSLKRSRDMRGAKRLTWSRLAGVVADLNAMADRVAAADPQRLRWFRYETLVREPGKIMRELAGWLGISFAPSLLEPTILGKPWPGHSSFAPTEGVSTAPLERLVTTLDDAEREYIDAGLGRFRAVFGA